MSPGKLIGYAILAAVLAALAVFVSPLVALLALAFVSGAPLFTIMVGASVIGALSITHTSGRTFDNEFDGMAASMLNVGLGDPVQVMSTIPLFIYAGYLLAESGTADRLVRFANALLGWLPGGLAIVTIGTCALFTVFTGASGVTIIALGGVLMPALVRQGYPERFSMGLIAGTGSVGLLFPPALPLFVYGTVCGLTINTHKPWTDGSDLPVWDWDTMRFVLSGVVPGAVLLTMLGAVAMFVAIKKKLPRQPFSGKELVSSFLLALPELVIPFGVIAGFAVVGFRLPEIASIAVLYVVVLEVGVSRLLIALGVKWGKPMPLRTLWGVSREGLAMVGAIFIIIFTSQIMTNYLVTADVPQKIVDWTYAHVGSKIVFLLAINVILLLVGTVMDIFSAIVIVLPLLLGIAHKFGIDPYHLGVIFLLNLEVGYLHPPVGLNLFITSIKFQRPITEVMWATIPFLVTMLLALFIITYVPFLTEVSTPETERVEPIATLVAQVQTAVDEQTAVRQVKIVDAAGGEIKDAKGQPVVKKLSDCDAIEDESTKGGCQKLFFDVRDCKGDKACAAKVISEWFAQNNEAADPQNQIILRSELPLVDASGAPVNDKKTGKQLVKKLSACEEGSLGDDCRTMFAQVTSCLVRSPASPDDCIKDAIAAYMKDHADAP